MNKFTFKEGTTIIAHGDNISFVNNTDSRIFHRPYSDLEFSIYKALKQQKLQPIQTNDIFTNDVSDTLINTGFAKYNDDFQADNYEVIEFQNPQILHALVMLTNSCNMKCKYCYTEANQHLKKEKELSGKEWIQLFNNIKIPSKYITQNLSITGGEPTTHPDIIEILESISNQYKTEISSNGLRLSNDLIKTLKGFKGLNFLNISMDSYRDYDDELMRGKGTFKPRMENIYKLHEAGLPLCFGVVINSITVETLEQTTNFFLETFPGTSIKYIPLTKMGLAESLPKEIFLSEEKIKLYIKSALKMREKYASRVLTDSTSIEHNDNTIKWSGRCSHMKFESEKDIISNISEDKKEIYFEKCNAAYGVVSLSPSGRLRPCLRADSFYNQIFELLQKDKIMPTINNLTKTQIENLPFWQYVAAEGRNFNPVNTCALKSSLYHISNFGEKNGF